MERIMKYINRVYRASVLDRASAFREQNLKGHQLSYILQICRKPGLMQDELANRLFVNKSSVTRQVAQLEKAGFVRRVEAPDDRRCRCIYPTEKAQELYPRIIDYLNAWNRVLTDELSPEDQEALLRLLRYLAKAASMKIHLANSAEREQEYETEESSC